MDDLYHIVKVPDPVLKQIAQPIENINSDVKAQAKTMINTMYYGAGIGLAANQVSKLNRIFIMDIPDDIWIYGPEVNGVLTIDSDYKSGEKEEEPVLNPTIFINPEVVWSSEQKSIYDEGCLSLPSQYGEVIRPAQVRVKYQDINGKTHEELFVGLNSHCVQHEIDHLDGILFIDYLSSLKRNMILRRMKKYNKEAQVL